MARTLLVVPAAAGVGLARTCLGLVRALDRRGVNVAFVKPVAQPRADGGPDRSIALVAATTALRPPDPLSTAELEQQLGSGGLDAVLEKIVAAWQPVHDRSDVVVVEGLSPGPTRAVRQRAQPGAGQSARRRRPAGRQLAGGRRGSGEDRADGAPGRDPDRRGRRRGPGRVARHHGQRVLVGRARPRGRLRGQRPAGGGSVGGSAAGEAWPSAGSASSPRCRTVPS
jgi:hypothetical protein